MSAQVLERGNSRQRLNALRGIYLGQTVLVVLTRVVAYSWFLQELGSHSLPIVYLFQGIPLCLFTILLIAIVDRVGRASVLMGLSAVYVVGVLLARGVGLSHPGWSPAFLLFGETAISLFGAHFWLLASELLSPEQAKRHYPSLALVGAVGAILAGGLVHLLPPAEPTSLLLYLLPAPVLVGVLAYYVHARYAYRVGPHRGVRESSWRLEIQGGLGLLRSSSLMRWLALLTASITSAGLLIDFLFNATAEHGRLASELPGFFGGIQVIVSVLQAALVLSLGSRIFTTFGLMRTLSSYPGGSLILTGAGLVAGSGLPLIGLKIFDRLENYLILNPGVGIVLNGFPRDRRGRASLMYGGIIKPVSIAVTGLLLYLLSADSQTLLLFALAYFLLFFGILYRLKLVYRSTLVENLASSDRRLVANSIEALGEPENRAVVERLLDFLARTEDPVFVENVYLAAGKIQDARLIPPLLEGLSDSNLSLKCAAVRSLSRFPGPKVRDELLAALREEDSARVKASILSALSADASGSEALQELLRAGLEDSDSRVQANAIEAVGLARDPALASELRPYLESEIPRARANAVVALARSAQYRSEALAALGRMLVSSDRSTFLSAIYAVGEVAEPVLTSVVQERLSSEDPDIRRNAAVALAKRDRLESVDALLEVLCSGDSWGRHVAQLLDRFGSGVRESLLERLAATSEEPRARAMEALKNCGVNYLDELEQLEFLAGLSSSSTPPIMLDTTGSQS